MLVQNGESNAYSNFVNSINSDQTRRIYEYTLSLFLKYYQTDLGSFLRLDRQEISNIIINYLLEKKISRQYKKVIFSAIKHAYEMNHVILNWRKLKKFIKSDYADNGINGKDRGYTHQEIKTILEYSDQRLKTAFLVLASTGMRVGALQTIRIGDLENIDNLYKIIVYAGDNEEYFSFTTPECAKEIDSYLDYRTRRGEKIKKNSCFFVGNLSSKTRVKGLPFKGKSLWAILEQGISNTGLREINHGNPLLGTQISMVLKMRAKKQNKFYKNCLTK